MKKINYLYPNYLPYQIVDFYLTNQGWIVSDVRNNSGEIVLKSSHKIPANYFFKITELTYKPGTASFNGFCSYIPNYNNYNNYLNNKKTIERLEKQFDRPYIPYI